MATEGGKAHSSPVMETFITDHDLYQAFLVDSPSCHHARANEIEKIKKDLIKLDLTLKDTKGANSTA